MLFIRMFFAPEFQPLEYLDPGSGSFILQLLLAAFLGAAVAFRAYWGKIMNFFKGKGSGEPDDSAQDDLMQDDSPQDDS